jgi:hypothetical protein
MFALAWVKLRARLTEVNFLGLAAHSGTERGLKLKIKIKSVFFVSLIRVCCFFAPRAVLLLSPRRVNH